MINRHQYIFIKSIIFLEYNFGRILHCICLDIGDKYLCYIILFLFAITFWGNFTLFFFIICETQKSYIKSFCITYNYLYIYISTIARSHFAQPFHNLIQLILSIINYILDFGLFYINRCECSRAVYSFRLLVILLA